MDGDGTHGRVILQSHLLREIMTCEFLRLAELTDAGKLRLTGRNRHRWAEYTLNTIPQQVWTIKDMQREWAETQRRRVTRVKMTPAERVRARELEAAAKLERKIARLGKPCAPTNPILAKRQEWQEYNREHIAEWRAQRVKRVALAHIAAKYIGKFSYRARVPWSEIYTACVAVGCAISADRGYGRVKARKQHKGITVDVYLRRLWQWAGLQSKPWDLQPHKLYRQDWGESFKDLQASRERYAEHVREVKELRALIESLKMDVVAEAVEFVS